MAASPPFYCERQRQKAARIGVGESIEKEPEDVRAVGFLLVRGPGYIIRLASESEVRRGSLSLSRYRGRALIRSLGGGARARES